MSKNIEDVYKEIIKLSKDIKELENKYTKEFSDLKKILKYMDRKLEEVSSKIQEFEIIMDAADIIEEHMEEEENKYNTEWNPYDDDSYSPEDYEDYENGDD